MRVPQAEHLPPRNVLVPASWWPHCGQRERGFDRLIAGSACTSAASASPWRASSAVRCGLLPSTRPMALPLQVAGRVAQPFAFQQLRQPVDHHVQEAADHQPQHARAQGDSSTSSGRDWHHPLRPPGRA
jgi:hypothetical protein